MTYRDVVLLSDREVMALNDDIYNGFWRRYRNQVLSPQSEEWCEIVRAAEELIQKYNSHPLAVHQIQDYLDQLEGRCLRRKAGKDSESGSVKE